MKLDNFINRPVLSTVISILIVILGAIGLVSLPITQYPDIAPPTVMVSATYTGANAQTVLNSVLPISKSEICEILQDVSPTTVESVLGKMVKTGSVMKLGQARATKYVNAKYIKKN